MKVITKEYNKKDALKVYNILEISFPKNEIPSLDIIKTYFNKDNLKFIGIENNSCKTIGVLIYYTLRSFNFITYLAILPEYQNKQIGTTILNKLKNNNKPLVLEVERPFNEKSKRRINWYKRNGFICYNINYYMPSLKRNLKPTPMFIMSDKTLLKKDLKDIITAIYKNEYNSFLSFDCNKDIPQIEEMLKGVEF